jgi:hypothetical protein
MNHEAVITAESLKKMGLTEIPKIRYDDLPAPIGSPDISKRVNCGKSKLLIDPILTAKFAGFIPDELIVDQTIDTLSYKPEWSTCITIRRDVAPPVNPLITRVTGIKPNVELENLMRFLAVELRNQAVYYGTLRIGPPYLWITNGKDEANGIYPLIGLMVKFDRTPPDAQVSDDLVADLGLLRPQ